MRKSQPWWTMLWLRVALNVLRRRHEDSRCRKREGISLMNPILWALMNWCSQKTYQNPLKPIVGHEDQLPSNNREESGWWFLRWAKQWEKRERCKWILFDSCLIFVWLCWILVIGVVGNGWYLGFIELLTSEFQAGNAIPRKITLSDKSIWNIVKKEFWH